VKPEEHKGFMIADGPRQMFKATKTESHSSGIAGLPCTS
jgi:hypothetical protein